ncbi:MAG: nucleotide sugar dehydrogenase [Elusimicrobiota bacterium]
MKVCVFGLGRIGLPITLVCADSGYKVVGIDVNERLVNSLKEGKIVFNEPGLKELVTKHLNKNFFPRHQDEDVTSDLKEAEYIILAVGTGFAIYPDKPNLSTLYSVIGQLIATGLRGKTIILRVTLPMGTCDNVKDFIEKKTSLKEGKDFWFSFVPERIMEGKAIIEERGLPKIVGAYNDKGFSKVNRFFKKIGGKIVRVSNPRTAEFIKLVDNSWRNTRFAFANELAFLAEINGVDVIEVIESANAGYERNEIAQPGPVTGYCLGKDPYLLELAFEEIARRRGFGSLWYYGRRANDWLVDKVMDETKGKNVLIAGLSFKEDIDDFRYSYGIEIARRLLAKGYRVAVCDPFLNKNYYTRLPDDLLDKVKGLNSIEKAVAQDIDTIIFTTRHREFQDFNIKSFMKECSKPVKIIDLWNIYAKLADKIHGIEYKGFGKGVKVCAISFL